MVKYALFARLQAKPGKEKEVEAFLEGALALAKKEKATRNWYAVKLGPSVFAIFDTFNDEAARDAHLQGEIAKGLLAKAGEWLARPPDIIKAPVIAAK